MRLVQTLFAAFQYKFIFSTLPLLHYVFVVVLGEFFLMIWYYLLYTMKHLLCLLKKVT